MWKKSNVQRIGSVLLGIRMRRCDVQGVCELKDVLWVVVLIWYFGVCNASQEFVIRQIEWNWSWAHTTHWICIVQSTLWWDSNDARQWQNNLCVLPTIKSKRPDAKRAWNDENSISICNIYVWIMIGFVKLFWRKILCTRCSQAQC